MPQEINKTPPDWLTDKKKLNEVAFCREFLQNHPVKCIGGAFFNVDGRIPEETIQRMIYEEIKDHVTMGVSKKVKNLIGVLKLECEAAPPPFQTDRIHVANGTVFLNGSFSEEKEFCRNRLPVTYNPSAPAPAAWLAYLHDLLIPEDILTVQEYFGYCLISTTKAQKMLMIIGKGGEGKSRLGIVLRALLGSNMNTGSIAKIESSPFARADLEHQLLLLDDDMKLEALSQTNHLKAIITAELPMDLERKGEQSYQGDLRVRFLGLGNGSLQSLYDRTQGFYRRQIILTTRDKPADRVDDPYLAEKMCAELEGIFLWALEGLKRLIANKYRFTISRAAEENMEEAISDGNNIVEFLKSEGYIRFQADQEARSSDLYEVYKLWCRENAEHPFAMKSFISFLKQNAKAYGLEYTNKIHYQGGMVRGFWGISIERKLYL